MRMIPTPMTKKTIQTKRKVVPDDGHLELEADGSGDSVESFSIRITKADKAAFAAMARLTGHSLNAFLIESARAVTALIETEPGKDFTWPRVVKIGRALKWDKDRLKMEE
jgi:hypothetical protein